MTQAYKTPDLVTSKILRMRLMAHANDFVRAIALTGKSLYTHVQVKSRDKYKNCTAQQVRNYSHKLVQTRQIPWCK